MRKSPNRLRFGIGKWQECIQLSPQSASLVESRSPCLLYEDMPTRWYRGHVSMCSAKGGRDGPIQCYCMPRQQMGSKLVHQ